VVQVLVWVHSDTDLLVGLMVHLFLRISALIVGLTSMEKDSLSAAGWAQNTLRDASSLEASRLLCPSIGASACHLSRYRWL